MNSNYGLPYGAFPSFSTSTPTNQGTQRPRFAYSAPPNYPRPRSSASKPNPGNDSFRNTSQYDNYPRGNFSQTSSMMNNYGDNSLQLDSSVDCNKYNASQSDESQYRNTSAYSSDSSSRYFSCDTSLGNTRSFSKQSIPQFNPGAPTNTGFKPNKQFNNWGNFSNSPSLNPHPAKKTWPKKPKMANKGPPQTYECLLCQVKLTSFVSLQMHEQGSRHMKNLKSKTHGEFDPNNVGDPNIECTDFEKKAYHCKLCDVASNSPIQLQMHLEGSKHRVNMNKLVNIEESFTSADLKPVMGKKRKSDGSAAQSEPKNNVAMFTCQTCCVVLNSDGQMKQHMDSKKHKNAVEGKPNTKKKRARFAQNPDQKNGENEEAKTAVLGVKTLESSFVQGGVMD